MRYAFTLAILTLYGSIALAQSPLAPGWIWAVEGGINTSEFGEHTDYSDLQPQVSPVIGIHWRYRSDSTVYIDAGVRYAVVGHTYSSYSSSWAGWTATQTWDVEENYKFHKISFGAGIGFYLGPKKRIFTGGGYRLLYYPKGNYFSQAVGTLTGSPPEYFHSDYDPMNNPDLQREASHIGHEFYYNAGIFVHPRVRIEIQFCFSKAITWEERTGYSVDKGYTTDDLSLSLFFALNKKATAK